jgi:hypothetical protein
MTAIDERQAESARRSAQDAQQRARIRELEDKFKRYRQASEDALSQLDWCIGYMHGWKEGWRDRSRATARTFAPTCLGGLRNQCPVNRLSESTLVQNACLDLVPA